MASPVDQSLDTGTRPREVAARVLNFAAGGPLLARTDLLATLPLVHESLQRYGLVAPPTAFPMKPFAQRFIWSSRLTNDPANRWIRQILMQCFEQVLQGSDIRLPRRRSRAPNAPDARTTRQPCAASAA